MASLCRSLTVLLFFSSPLFHSQLFARGSTSSPPITRKRITYLYGLGFEKDDTNYDDYSLAPEVVTSAKTSQVFNTVKFCVYDPCLENPEPCENQEAKNMCRCPGKSSGDERPHPPQIKALLPITAGGDRGKIEVQWCAPNSVVSSYQVTVEGRGDELEFEEASRRGLVDSLEVGTKVCVKAINKAGHSSSTCRRYEHPASNDNYLLAGVTAGGAVLILLVVIVAVVLCRRQMRQNARQEAVNGLGNPSYKVERVS